MTKLPKHPFDRARGRRLMGAWTGLALAVCVLTAPALAADDPLTIVNNLSEFIFSRSEERRVGKEGPWMCRSRWSPYH